MKVQEYPTKLFRLALSLLFLGYGLGPLLAQSVYGTQGPNFTVQILQDGKTMEAKDGIYHLKRQAFAFQFKMINIEGLYVNVSASDSAFQMVQNKQNLGTLISSNGIWMGGAEYPANKDLDVSLKKDAQSWQYWYVDKDNSRFDQVRVQADGTRLCTRTVANFFEIQTQISTPMEKTPHAHWYLVLSFLEDKYNNDFYIEKQTASFIIEFE